MNITKGGKRMTISEKDFKTTKIPLNIDEENGSKIEIYVDNAATTKMSIASIEAMLPYLETMYANPSSLHLPGQKAADVLLNARKDIANILRCNVREIYFTSGGSEADNQAIMSAAKYGAKIGKRHIISTAFEHHAVLHTLNQLEKQGYEITLLDVHEDGLVRLEELESAIRTDTVLVTIMYANNEIGTIQPIKEIGKICREKKILFHTDGVQAAGYINIDVNELNVDMLSISAHKFHGPKGVGLLYAKKGVPLVSLIEGGAQEYGKRAGTENIAAIISMAAALKSAYIQNNEKLSEIKVMRDKLIDELTKVPHSILNGDRENRLPANVSICFEGIEGEALLILLSEKGIYASSGSACTSGALDPSHVLLAIGRPHEIAHGSLRISLSKYNTWEEIDYIIKTVPEVVAYLRNMSPVWKDLEEGKSKYVIQ